jgi:hypothetical protein
MSKDTNEVQENIIDDAVVAFVEEAGLAAFESALIQYLADIEEEAAEKFEKYIETHSEADTFIEDLCADYSDFAALLKEEITELQADLKELSEVE